MMHCDAVDRSGQDQGLGGHLDIADNPPGYRDDIGPTILIRQDDFDFPIEDTLMVRIRGDLHLGQQTADRLERLRGGDGGRHETHAAAVGLRRSDRFDAPTRLPVVVEAKGERG